MNTRHLRAGLLVFATLGCGSDATGPAAESLTILSGDAQVGIQNTALPQTIVVQALQNDGNPLVGARVRLTTAVESGIILEADSLTDSQGRASFRWQLGESWVNTVGVSLPDHRAATILARAWARYRHTAPEETSDGWPTATPGEMGLNEEPLTRLMDSLRAGVIPEVHSMIIVKDGTLVLEAYFPGHDFGYASPDFLGSWVDWGRNTRHNTHSATKSIISALAGIAIDQGLIPDEDERVFDFFPDYADYNVGGKNDITIRHLLTMTSGLEWHEWDAPVGTALNDIDAFNRSTDPIGYVLEKPLAAPPGTLFNYSGGGVNVLCQLVARAAGVGIEDFADDHLFGPMGVTNYNFPRLSSGMVVCHGDIYITPRDLAKFGQLYLNRGVWQGERIISEEWVQRSVTPSISLASFALGWADDYGYLWWMKDYRAGETTFSAFKAIGWGGQEIFVVPEEDLVVVFTGANYTVNPPCDALMSWAVFPSLGGE